MKMNLPNKLTIARIIMVLPFVYFLDKSAEIPQYKWIALALFCIASLTDLLDGYIARKYNLITDFGKFMDPLADKVLVNAAFIIFVGLGRVPAWMVILTVTREFIISGFRLIAAEKGIVIAANIWGKLKTNFQMFTAILIICDFGTPAVHTIEQIMLYITMALTVISLVVYIVQNKKVIS